MGSRSWTLGVVVLLLTGLAPRTVAQDMVAPGSLAAVEGGGGTSIPFGLDRPVRMQCIYDPDELSFSGSRMFQKLMFRADFSTAAGRDQYPEKQFLIVHLAMSTTRVPAWEASTTFAENHGTDLTQVTTDARISLPAQPPLLGGPRPFDIEIPFDRPWFYGTTPVRGTGAAPAGLLFDLHVELQPAGAFRVDVPGTCSSQPVSFGDLGAQCVTSPSGLPLTLQASSSTVAGGNLTFTVSEMPPGALFGVALAVSDQGTWFDNPLPFDLGGYLQGAPGCWIHVPWQAVLVGQANPAGSGQVTTQIPLDRNHVGSSLYAQAICRDLAANQLLHVTSRGLRTQVCGPLGVVRVYSIGDALSETGQRSIGVAPVIELR